MYLEIPYETALARHPELVAEVMATLAKGKSREKGSPPESLTWGYYWGVTVQSLSFAQMIRGEVPVETRSLEQRTSCALKGSKGRWYGVAWPKDGIRPVPQEVMDNMKPWSGDQ